MLLSAPHDADTNLKLLAKVVGGCGGGVRAAAEDALHSILGVQRGAVTPLAVANDEERKLIIVWDKGMMGEGKIIVHPMVNTASTEIEKGDLYKYVKHFGYEPIIVDF